MPASAEVVAPVLLDIVRWPEWTPTFRGVEALDGPELVVGRRFRVRQPRLPAAVWTVELVEPGRCFRWSSRVPGVVTRAHHEVTADGESACRVRLVLEQSGPGSGVSGLVYGRLIRGFLVTELDSLARRCGDPGVD